MDSPRSKTVDVNGSSLSSPSEYMISPLVILETIGEIDKTLSTFITMHEISKDLRKAYLDLPREQHFNVEPDFASWVVPFEWKDKDGLTQRVFDRLNHLNVSLWQLQFGNRISRQFEKTS